jgi:hypothetical protein
MWIALGLVGGLWIAGMWIWPDKNAPPPSHASAPASTVASGETAAPPSTPR